MAMNFLSKCFPNSRCRNTRRPKGEPRFSALLEALEDRTVPSLAILDPPGSISTYATRISGTNIVGFYVENNGRQHGFLYDGSGYTTLDPPRSIGSDARGISGTNIVGTYYAIEDGWHGFLYDGSSYTTLDPPGSLNSWAAEISGTSIVGYYRSGGDTHGFLYDGSSYITIDPPGSQATYPNGISGGIIVGTYVDNDTSHGFLYDGARFTTIDAPNSVLGTSINGISGINIIGGYYDSVGFPHGFLYDGASFTTLDPPGSFYSYANGISGTSIVGTYRDSDGQHGFLYDGASYTTLLDPPGSQYTVPVRISDNSIVGWFIDGDNVKHGFLYQPDEVDIAVVDATTRDFTNIDLKYSISGSDSPAFIIRAYLSSDAEYNPGIDLPLQGQLGISDPQDRKARVDPYLKTMTLVSRAPISENQRFIIIVADPDNAIEAANSTTRNNNATFAIPLFVEHQNMNRSGNSSDETASSASGPLTGAILRDTDDFARLVRLDSPPSIPPQPWGTPPFEFLYHTNETEPWQLEEDRLVQASVMQPTSDFVGLINSDRNRVSDFWADVVFSINEAYDSTGGHGSTSLHYEGRAMDIQPIATDSDHLSRLAGLAWLAGFDWVYFENQAHIHVSERASFPTTINQQSLQQAVAGALTLGRIDNSGVANSLNQKLDGFEEALTQGLLTAARGKLQAFRNAVLAQQGHHIVDTKFANLLLRNVDVLLSRLQSPFGAAFGAKSVHHCERTEDQLRCGAADQLSGCGVEFIDR